MASSHLIHIGFPKSGSTFLQEWFTQHPEMHYDFDCLGGFRNLYGVCNYSSTPAITKPRYFVTSFEGISMPLQGNNAVELGYSLQGTLQPMQVSQQRACDIVQDLFPNGQILIVTRGFKGIIQSCYSQAVKLGGTLRPDELPTLFQPPDFHKSNKGASQLSSCWPTGANNPFDFDFVIGLYWQSFGEENVIVLPYELLRDDQDQFLGILEERLGVAHLDIDLGRLNPSLSPAELYWYPRISRHIRRVANRLGNRGREKARTWHVDQIVDNRWRRVIKFLERRWPHKKITSADFPVEMYESCRGKAESLRGNPLYAPYGAEYLWE